ncbi:MAG TPA: NAD(P)-dependent oxidoreductase [Steroidobacteraceae bacterium]|nr:NAD(P)-dependent oxidoreductase [Steroidobacteraceae bacterium]
MTTIAFIGLGNMGAGMARRLLQAGHQVRVYNRTSSKAAELERAGASRYDTPREACMDAEAVFAMTADDTSSRTIWSGPDGVFAARLAPRAFAIECSTLSYSWVTELAEQARARGLRYIDSPVTGLADAAAAGKLTLLVGAEAADLEAARPLLDQISDRILHFGTVGAGTSYKLIVNLIGAIQIASLAEGMALAEKAGLDLQTVADAIATGQAASPQVVRNARRIVADDHDRNVVFTPVLRLKDVDYALQLARELGLRAPFGQVAAEHLRRLIDLGHSSVNESKIIEVARLQST